MTMTAVLLVVNLKKNKLIKKKKCSFGGECAYSEKISIKMFGFCKHHLSPVCPDI